MDFYESLLKQSTPVYIEPSETSYFSKSSGILDPRLFRNHKLIPAVRDGILSILHSYLGLNFSDVASWTTPYLAGSGVSYQWAAHRDPADLDCLVAVNFEKFRQLHDAFQRLSDQEIASMLNDLFRTELWPQTDNYLDSFELTFYVNVEPNITKLKPYAAYSLISDDWVVAPEEHHIDIPKEWEQKAGLDISKSQAIVARYQEALELAKSSHMPNVRANARSTMQLAVSQANALFEDIHRGRSAAFSESGKGYADYANYRWQHGKEFGAVQALKKIKDMAQEAQRESEIALYGAELPSTATLVRRAATQYGKK